MRINDNKKDRTKNPPLYYVLARRAAKVYTHRRFTVSSEPSAESNKLDDGYHGCHGACKDSHRNVATGTASKAKGLTLDGFDDFLTLGANATMADIHTKLRSLPSDVQMMGVLQSTHSGLLPALLLSLLPASRAILGAFGRGPSKTIILPLPTVTTCTPLP